MEAFDLAHKLAYAGEHSPVPFLTGPRFLNSVVAVPVLSQLRIFIDQELWNEENVMTVAKEVCRVLGPTSVFDIGMTLGGKRTYDGRVSARGETARLMKLDPNDPRVTLHIEGRLGDRLYEARFPRLDFQYSGEDDDWREVYAPGAVKDTHQL
jgi:hypothetical protein